MITLDLKHIFKVGNYLGDFAPSAKMSLKDDTNLKIHWRALNPTDHYMRKLGYIVLVQVNIEENISQVLLPWCIVNVILF